MEKVFTAILQDIQFHPLTDRILHVDFLQTFDDKEVTVSIPINFIGTPIGVRNGGNLLVRKELLKLVLLPLIFQMLLILILKN